MLPSSLFSAMRVLDCGGGALQRGFEAPDRGSWRARQGPPASGKRPPTQAVAARLALLVRVVGRSASGCRQQVHEAVVATCRHHAEVAAWREIRAIENGDA